MYNLITRTINLHNYNGTSFIVYEEKLNIAAMVSKGESTSTFALIKLNLFSSFENVSRCTSFNFN